jgi:hypothetical protein
MAKDRQKSYRKLLEGVNATTYITGNASTMTTLQLAKGAKQLGFAQSPARLYRSVIK